MFFIFSLLIQILIIKLILNAIFSVFRNDNNRTGQDDRQQYSDWTYRTYSTGGNPYSSPTPALANAYQTLGISPDASDSEVKSAYKRLAMKFHPDRFATSGQETQHKAEEQFKKINEAYQIIKKKRGLD